MNKLARDGWTLSYDIHGDGDPVMLVGGLGMAPSGWLFSQVPALTGKGYSVITPANRGMHPSDSPPPPYTVADMAADMAALLDHLGLTQVRLVGSSLGGFIVEELCRTRPELVRRAVLIASATRTTAFARLAVEAEQELYRAGPVPLSYEVFHTIQYGLPPSTLQDNDAAVLGWKRLLDTRTTGDENGRIGQSQAGWSWLLRPDDPERFRRVKQPCLVIAFEHDLHFPPSGCAKAAAEMPCGEFRMIGGVGHAGIFEKPEVINREILDFFARH